MTSFQIRMYEIIEEVVKLAIFKVETLPIQ